MCLTRVYVCVDSLWRFFELLNDDCKDVSANQKFGIVFVVILVNVDNSQRLCSIDNDKPNKGRSEFRSPSAANSNSH